jgi:DNA invertase Pin-like site-specific DNA recombinase
VPGLSMERQEEMLEAIGLDLSDGKIYRDSLSRPKVRKRAPLPERDFAISPRHPGETIYVASLRVLGWDSHEVIRMMALAAKYAAKIHCVDTGETYSAETTAPEILSALTRAEAARRRARMAPAASGARATQKRRVEKGLAIAKEHWGRPPGEISVAEIAKLAGLSTRTLYTHLPPRTLAQEEAALGKRHA